MKYEKIKDGLISILNSLNYQFKLYDGDGSAISNPYEAKYIFVKEPNMMFIIEEERNTVELHKSDMKTSTFKKILQLVRQLTKKYFINLEVSNYNQILQPKDFSKDILKKRYNLKQMMNAVNESFKSEQTSYELYDNILFVDNGINIKVINESNEVQIINHDLRPFLPAIAEGVDHSKISRLLERKKQLDKSGGSVKLESRGSDNTLAQIVDLLNKMSF